MSSSKTIYDVAALAGVSISTVSLALNSPARVSAETRRKVLEAVDALGFAPKPEAVAKARRGVGRIGVIAPYTSYPSVAQRLNGILRFVSHRPLEIVLFDQVSAAQSSSPLLASLPITGRLDGLIVISLPLDEVVAKRLTTLRLPTVLIDVRYPGFDAILTSDSLGGRLVAEHLIAQGHCHFAFLGETQQSSLYVSPAQQRLIGYRSALQEAGYSLAEDDVRFTLHGVEPAMNMAMELLAQEKRPTAVFASSDTLAAGVLRAARKLGLSVPDEVAIVGFDDGELAEALDLTTVRQPLEETGRAAMERLLQQLEKPTTTREVMLNLELVKRATG
ncbi:LacI family transcriptional regulator [Ktedonosporobacter rubrisoli]|uniref:LacI family transcriptional regulator n=1 Tax=Ktedonosporobacter rubrisoli TaxID=2509675 RepID=A0A4P6JNY7_KTERU|nr:LacI family DNA-binding transcriptional regulator [Ktedonosporobacter rubrisoli]QBD76955.1 LacI family transcriptional regulator [Ktedonosporobacter rubrisoli]